MTFFCEAEADRLAWRRDPRNPSPENARSDTSELPETLSVFGRTSHLPRHKGASALDLRGAKSLTLTSTA